MAKVRNGYPPAYKEKPTNQRPKSSQEQADDSRKQMVVKSRNKWQIRDESPVCKTIDCANEVDQWGDHCDPCQESIEWRKRMRKSIENGVSRT